MRKSVCDNTLKYIQIQESKLTFNMDKVIDEATSMITFLRERLSDLKKTVLEEGFADFKEEINFFKNVKPHILGKLIYYNAVYGIETSCPVKSGEIYLSYFNCAMSRLKKEYKDDLCKSDFYKYYRSGRTDLDEKFYRLGNVDFAGEIKSFVFEIDLDFSTYYDHKAAHIIANDLLHEYLQLRLNPDILQQSSTSGLQNYADLFWTDSKNALIELIYALHAARSVSNGRLGVGKICMALESILSVELGDMHHAFHRMKVRAGSKTAFLDYLKENLEKYMNKGLD